MFCAPFCCSLLLQYTVIVILFLSSIIQGCLSMSYHLDPFCSHLSVLNLFPYNAENPGLYKDNDSRPSGSSGGKATDTKKPDGVGAGRREAASDEFMLERFRKREKFRALRR